MMVNNNASARTTGLIQCSIELIRVAGLKKPVFDSQV